MDSGSDLLLAAPVVVWRLLVQSTDRSDGRPIRQLLSATTSLTARTAPASPLAGAIKVQALDCVTSPSGPNGGLNHVEIHVSQNQLDVYATDAGTITPLHHIAVVQNANLTFTRGLVWIEDAHYNAAKFGGQTEHTFAWDNVGFDGPVLPRDLTFDVPDSMLPVAGGNFNLGWSAAPGNGPTFGILGVTGVPNASGALVTLDYFANAKPSNLTISLNGHSHSVVPSGAPALNANGGMTAMSMAVSVPLSDVVAGTNTLQVSTDLGGIVSNVDLVLFGAGGTSGNPPPPASTSTPTVVPTATNTVIPGITRTATPVTGTHTCTTLFSLNGTPTVYSRPASACANQ